MDIFAGFVDNPKLYLTAMRLTFVYSTPLFILAIYVIITASHPTSSSLFRWFPMYQVCLYYTTDMFVGPGVTPIIYLPLLAGYPAGFARTLGIPTPVLVGLTYSSCWYKALSIAVLFYIRYDAILPNDYPFKPKRSWAFTVFALYHLMFLMLTPFVIHSIVPDQTFAKKKLLEEYPTAPSSLNQPETIVIEVPYGAKTMFIIVVFFMPSVFIITTSTYTVSFCLYYLHQQKYSLSVKTLAIQRAILFSTIAEVGRCI